MFVQPRHDLDEIAGARAVIELGGQDAVPAVAAGAGRAWQTEDEGRPRHACGGSALDGRGADLGVAEQMKGDRESVHALFEQRLDRLRRDVAPREAGTAGGDDGVDTLISNPSSHHRADRLDIVLHDLARGELVAGRGETVDERGSGFVVGNRARVRNGQHRNVERNELLRLIDGGHAPLLLSCPALGPASPARAQAHCAGHPRLQTVSVAKSWMAWSSPAKTNPLFDQPLCY